MASRLSEESLKAVYETGHQGFQVTPETPLDLVSVAPINLDALVVLDDAEEQIQALAPQPLYHALIHRGLEDSLDVLQHLSQEQLVRIFDYDVWSQDQLVKDRAFKWLSLYKELGDEELQRRFRQLDEEYQLALLGSLITTVDEEEFETLPEAAQDILNRLPCGTLYYRIESQDPQQHQIIEALVQACLATDINYTYSVLTHASYLPPNEQEALIAQFRRARIEEDGFISYEESLAVFRPLDLERWRAKWSARSDSGQASDSTSQMLPAQNRVSNSIFLGRVVQQGSSLLTTEDLLQLNAGFAFLGNTLCSAARVGADDLEALRRLLEQAQALASLGLEYLAGGMTDLGAEILKKEHPQVLFRAGLALVGKLQGALIERLEISGIAGSEGLRKLWQADKRGSLLHRLESQLASALGFERVELLKGLLNRFPLKPLTISKPLESEGAERLIYSPVATIAALQDLARTIDGVSGLLHLASLAKAKDAPLLDLDRHLLTAVARVLLGGEFQASPLSQDELQAFIDRPQAEVQALTTEFFTGVEGTLRTALLDTNDVTATTLWAVSRSLDVAFHDPLQAVMADLSDLLLQLHQQRETARAGQRNALVGLLFVAQA